MSYYAAFNTPNCSFSIIEERTNLSDFEKMEKEHIQFIIPSSNGYLLRPYVKLKGQKNGYCLSKNSKGLWRKFLNCQKKNFTLKNTGKYFVFLFLVSTA